MSAYSFRDKTLKVGFLQGELCCITFIQRSYQWRLNFQVPAPSAFLLPPQSAAWPTVPKTRKADVDSFHFIISRHAVITLSELPEPLSLKPGLRFSFFKSSLKASLHASCSICYTDYLTPLSGKIVQTCFQETGRWGFFPLRLFVLWVWFGFLFCLK